MKTTLDIPDDLLKNAMTMAGSKTKRKAVVIALEEYIRKKKIEKIIEMAGKLEFSDKWSAERHDR